MNRLFFRFFVLVMLAITAATFVIYFVLNRWFGDPLEEIAVRQASAQIFLLEQYIDKAAPDEWLVRLNKVREVSNMHLELLPLDEARKSLTPARAAALDRGEIVMDVANRAFLRRVDREGQRYIGSADDVIFARDLPIDVSLAIKMEALRYLIVALALLIPIALWSRSHWQGLQQLSRVADQFGEGDLAARAKVARTDSIYPLAGRINHMADRIQTLLETQQNLLNSVSHELRTPLARLEFGLELLRKPASGDKLERRIAAMEGDVRELNDLVGELLSMSRMDRQASLTPAPFALASALRHCVDSLEPGGPALDIGLQLTPDCDPVWADERLTMRALGNLVRNAVKYAQRRIDIAAWRRADGALCVTVDDDGPGIPEAEREKIFTPFYRLDRSRDRATGGFGLGLSIAQKAILLHGGTIEVADSALGGARFVVTLPPAPAGIAPGC